MSKKLINGLKYEKLSEDQLYDLSPWELVDIILAYRKDIEVKQQECETLASQLDFEVQKKECLEQECETLKDENFHLRNEGKKSCAYCADLIAKQQECERLKEENAEIRKYQYEQDFLQEQLDQLNAEQNIIKAVCENHFDEYEMGCLNLSEAIESLLERYDNAITGLMKDRKELKAENEQLKKAEEYDSRYSDLQAEIDCGERMIEKLKQTLTKIKEIAEDYEKDQDFICFMVNLNKTLQKINECEVKSES